MKTFDYQSNCVKYHKCFFDIGKYQENKMSIAIYGLVESNKDTSYIANLTINSEEKLNHDEIVLDTYSNSNILSFMMDLGIIKRVIRRTCANFILVPVVQIDKEILLEYSYDTQYLKNVS